MDLTQLTNFIQSSSDVSFQLKVELFSFFFILKYVEISIA